MVLVAKPKSSKSSTAAARWIRKKNLQLTRWYPRSRRDYMLLVAAVLLIALSGVGMYKCVDCLLRWFWLPKYASRSERNFRRQRFPSVDDRVRIYMSNWYEPPCDSEGHVVYRRKLNATAAAVEASRRTFFGGSSSGNPNAHYYYEMTELKSTLDYPQRAVILDNQIQIGRMFFIDKVNLRKCYLQRRFSIRFYCSDSAKSILNTAMPDIGWANDDPLPVLCQFGDETESFAHDASDVSSYQSNPRIPHIKKIRFALSREEIDRLAQPTDGARDSKHEDCHRGPRLPPTGMTQMQPIIWLLNINRHFKYSWDVRRYDIPWNDKRDAAVFRGLLTGLEYDADASDEENCHNLIRCRLVFETADSVIVDAKLTSTFDKVPAILHGVNLTGAQLRKEELLGYKGFIILEGNDVSSGLKWAMVSNSVVLMPPPRFTSWSMEELLEPWVHFIPIRTDLSDVEEKTWWMLDHQAEAQRIAHRARLWVLDLYYHPDAMNDNRRINQEVLRRYRAHFRS